MHRPKGTIFEFTLAYLLYGVVSTAHDLDSLREWLNGSYGTAERGGGEG